MSAPRRIASLLAVVVFAALPACGDSPKPSAPPATPPPAAASTVGFALEGAAGARAVVDAYYAAARAADLDGMLALGTPEWQTKEKTAPRRFSPAIAKKQLTVKTARIDEPAVTGDSATVHVGVVFVDEKGRDDKEGMNFTLVRKDGRWWITDLG
jgi:hypothetical protein